MISGATTKVLSAGGLDFTCHEMGRGPLVLCLHGFPDTPYTWRHLLPRLAAEGFRAVAVTSRGYEPSSQPSDADYSMAALSDDVVGWVEALGERAAHLIGHDWGSSIMHAVAARAPERVLSLTALAVPHPVGFAAVLTSSFEQLQRSWYVYLFQIRGLSEALVEREDWEFLAELWRRWSPDWTPPSKDITYVKECFSRPGVRDAALSYYRAALQSDHPRAAESRQLWGQRIGAPVLGLTGALDGCIAPEIFVAAMAPDLFARAPKTRQLKGVGHFLHLEKPAHVGRLVAEHIKRSADERHGA